MMALMLSSLANFTSSEEIFLEEEIVPIMETTPIFSSKRPVEDGLKK